MRRVCCASTRLWSISRGWANASRIASGVISEKVTRRAFSGGTLRRLGDMPGDRLAFAVEVSGEVDGLGRLRLLGDRRDLLLAILGDHVFGREVMLDVDAQLVLAGVLGKVAHMAVRGQHPVAGTQVSLDRARLCRRLDDHKVLCHLFTTLARVVPFDRRAWRASQIWRMRARRSSSASSVASSSTRLRRFCVLWFWLGLHRATPRAGRTSR